MKVCIRRFAAVLLAALFVALPVCAEGEEEEATSTNKGKMKEGASQFFEGLKGSFHDAGDSARKKVDRMNTAAYIGDWEFENGTYETTIEIDDDGTMEIEQDGVFGENTWTGTYDVEKKKVIFFHILRENGERVKKEWVINFNAKKGEYIIIWSDDIPDDPNGHSFAGKTLFTYDSDDDD